MAPTTITTIFIFAIIFTIIGYDLFAVLYWGFDSTITTVIKSAGDNYPILPPIVAFAMGALYGHFFL